MARRSSDQVVSQHIGELVPRLDGWSTGYGYFEQREKQIECYFDGFVVL